MKTKYNKRRFKTLIMIIILLLCMSIGYSYLLTTLNIEGTSNIKSNTWDVHWENVSVKSGSVTGDQVPIAAHILTDTTQVEYSVILKNPGDYYEFTVDAKNSGSLDAMVSVVDTKFYEANGVTQISLPSYLEYTFTYDDGIPIEQNQILKANTLEKLKVKIKFKDNLEESQLPTTDKTIVIRQSINYIQSDENSTPVRTTLFSYPEDQDYSLLNDMTEFPQDYSLLNDMTEFPNTYETMEEVISATGQPFFIKGIITQGEVSSIEVGLKYNENIYYFKGGINEQGLTEKPTFENNISIAQNFFGSSNCSLTQGTTTNYYFCNSQSKHLSATLTDSGMVTIGSEDNPFNRCRINNNTSNDYYIRCGAWAD